MNNIKTLLRLFFKLDFRDKDSKSFKKIIGVLVSYLIAGLGLSVNYFLNYDYTSSIILIYSLNSFLIIFLVLSEYPNLFFSKANIDIIKPLPISNSEFIITKISSAFIYILFFAFILSIPQTILFVIIFKKIYYYSLAFFLQGIFLSLFLTTAVLIIYSIAIKLFSERASVLLYIIQALFILLVMLSTSFSSKAENQERFSIMHYTYVKYLPQYYFTLGIYNVIYLILSFLLTFLVILLFYKIIKKNFNDLLYKLSYTKSGKKFRFYTILNSFERIDRTLEKLFLKTKDEKAGFYIAKKVVTSSKSMILKFIPVLFMPIIIVLIGIITENKSLLLINDISNIGILSPSITLIIIMMFRITTSNIKFADENSENINWIYESLPFKNPKLVYSGCIKYFYFYYFFPIMIIITILLITKLNLEIVLLNIFFIFPLANLLTKVLSSKAKIYPFTIEPIKFNTLARFGEVFISLFFGIIVFILQLLIFKNITYILISIIFILSLNFFLNYTILHYDARTRKIRFGSSSS